MRNIITDFCIKSLLMFNIRYHGWLYYFRKEPPYERRDAKLVEKEKLKATTHNEMSFSIEKGCGLDFVVWLSSIWGGDKSVRDAKTVGRRAMKFLYHAMSGGENGSSAIEEYVDCILGAPNLLLRFLKHLIENIQLKASAVLSYLRAISDLADFRKSKGCSDSVLRAFAVTEVYLRRCKATMQRRKNMEYTRDLDLETLVSRNSWATLQEVCFS